MLLDTYGGHCLTYDGDGEVGEEQRVARNNTHHKMYCWEMVAKMILIVGHGQRYDLSLADGWTE